MSAGADATGLAARRAHDSELLVEQLRYVAANSAFYASCWSAEQRARSASASAEGLQDLLADLPLTTKDALRRAEEEAPPFGTDLACDPDEVALVHRTSGTTGRPLVVALTAADSALTSERGGAAFSCAGLGPGDVVVHCLNYSMWAGGFTDHRCLEASGAAVVPFGVGNTEELMAMQAWLPFDAISCTPSYVRLLLERLAGTDLDLWRRNLRLALVGGEPGGSEVALGQYVRDQLNARLVNANYGLAEVLSNFGSECGGAEGMHFHGHGAIWLELLDENGHQLPLERGSRGEVVLTHIKRRAQPLVRYQTKDLMEILETDPCPCGRDSFRFQLHGRSDDMFVVRGINVFPAAVGRALAEVSPALSEFAIVLPDRENFDRVPLLVETEGEIPADLAGEIEDSVRRSIGCGIELTLLARGALPRTEGKTRRLYRDGMQPTVVTLGR